MRKVRLPLLVAPLIVVASAASASAQSRLGPLARQAALQAVGVTQVIVRAPDADSMAQLLPAIEQAGGVLGRDLPIIHGRVATLPSAAIDGLSQNPLVEQISVDRPIRGSLERTGTTIGSIAVRQTFGYDGSGINIAVIDSGASGAIDDLGGSASPRSWTS